MDPQKASRLREFLLHHPVEEWLALETLTCSSDPHLKKALFLCRLSADLSSRAFSRDTLRCLELLRGLDRSPGAPLVPFTERALHSAYFAVAAELTSAPLRKGATRGADVAGDGFVEAVHSIWDGRMSGLGQSEARGLVGEELRQWGALISEAVRDAEAREKLRRRNTRREATEALRKYLRLAVKDMGPPLLDLVVRTAAKGGGGARAVEGADERGGGEFSACPSGGSARAGPSTGAPGQRQRRLFPAPVTATDQGIPEIEPNQTNAIAAETGEFTGGGAWMSPRLIPPFSSPAPPKEVNTLMMKEALQRSREEPPENMAVDPHPAVPERAAALPIGMSEKPANPGENQNRAGVHGQRSSVPRDVLHSVSDSGGEVAAQTAVVKWLHIRRWISEQSALLSSSPGAKRLVWEALKSSCDELLNVVAVECLPLPDALERAAGLQVSAAESSATPTDACGNQTRAGSNDLASSSVLEHIAGDSNGGAGRNRIPSPPPPQPKLVMDTTTHTHEGDGDFANSPLNISASSSNRRVSARIRTSTSKLQEFPKFVRTRKIKKWTPKETEALREAVKQYANSCVDRRNMR